MSIDTATAVQIQKAVTQQTKNIFITFVQRRPNVSDAGPALYKYYTNVLCLLGLPEK